jgi:hypothetical protein
MIDPFNELGYNVGVQGTPVQHPGTIRQGMLASDLPALDGEVECALTTK